MKYQFTLIFGVITLLCFEHAFSQSVKASSYGMNNPTNAIIMALSSDYDTILIDAQEDLWRLRPLRFNNLKEKVIVFDKDVVLRALPNAFPNTNEMLLRFTNCHNITIIGNGSILMMNKAEYTEGEWRHGIGLLGCSNFKIVDLTVCDTGGDGIYIAGSKEVNYSQNVLLDSIKSLNNKRQGISIMSAKDIVIKNCVFKNTIGTLPGAGIDFEPNKPGDVIQGIKVANCLFSENYGPGVMIAMGKLDADSEDIRITFKNCVLNDNQAVEHPRVGTEIRISANKISPVGGSVVFEECVIENSRWGLLYSRKRSDAFNVVFKDCMIRNTSQNGKSATVYLEVPDYYANYGSLGGFKFENLYIENNPTVNFLMVRGSKLGTLKDIKNIEGNIILNKSNQELLKYINYSPENNSNVKLNFITKL